ncbi:peptidoglycan recognition family protein [Arcicella sp. LKC2W]|uniref:N-acetylmuramoyl-L-alanine amidase n=1 Tax=Arcicella sp. LKC2W TaxID=2984198 RepID=UPI002B1F0BAD|nr:peptidoglycan recognition family protein [Arcicella sp. LKC2W]MEA5457771.1 peptidoglycan recognition family protein [Arcicella sp. LKC2W]
MKQIIFFVFLFIMVFKGFSQKIIERPIIYDSTRKALSLQYLQERHNLTLTEPSISPKIIVSHWTAIPTLEGSFNAFNPVLLPNVRKELKGASPLNVSIHFLVDRDGTIYRLMPENLMARHVIGLNWCALGIENVGDGNKFPLTEAQLKANIWLVKYLKKKYQSIEYLIGHHEYTSFQNTPLWKETDANYRTEKSDPGKEFMEKLRNGVKKLNLKGSY